MMIMRVMICFIMVMLLLVSSRGEGESRFDQPAATRTASKGRWSSAGYPAGFGDCQRRVSRDHDASIWFRVGAAPSKGMRLRGGRQEDEHANAAAAAAAAADPAAIDGDLRDGGDGGGGYVIRVVDGRVGGGRSDGLGVNVIVNGSETVADLKCRIADRLNITAGSQRMIYLGRELSDGPPPSKTPMPLSTTPCSAPWPVFCLSDLRICHVAVCYFVT